MPNGTASWGAEAAYAEFKSHFEEFAKLAESVNEADTRLRLIDTMLFEILDWSKSDTNTEKYCREVGFADYVFSTQENISLVLEAKKVGISFTVPNASFKTDPVCFSLLESECKEVGSALRQALGYAASLGSRYIAITNGHQWIFALTYVQSQSIDDRQVIVFDSLEAVLNNFRMFWNCFSKSAIGTNAIYPTLLESRKKPAPQKFSASIPGYPVPSSRNRYLNELTYILNTVWDVLSRTENTQLFLDSCYVPSVANQHSIEFAKNVLKRRLAADKIAQQADVKHVKSGELKNVIIGYENEKPFVILGEVGHGKTTFLNYLRLVEAKELFSNYVQLEANFLDRPDSAPEVTDYIYKQIEEQLLDRHKLDIYEDSIVRGALHIQLERFARSSRLALCEDAKARSAEERRFIQEQLADRHAYLTSLMRHLKKGQKKSVALFFDNLDRRSSEIQEAAFLKASAIARDWECVVFICLRPKTFYESLKRGLLDSLAPKTFTVGSSDLSLILKRRFKFAEEIASGRIKNPLLDDALKDRSIALHLPSVAKLFACCEFSTRKDANAIAMLAAISNGNIRVLLELTKRMLTSGYLDTGKILNKLKTSLNYLVPDFEAVKTLLYGDHDQYDPASSLFVNLFDIYHADPKEHFIRCLTLDYLNRFNDPDGGRAWKSYADVAGYLESNYFDVATIQRHLNVLIQAECVEAEVGIVGEDSRGQALRITTRGSYHIRNLVSEFQYVDALTIDTPITCPATRAEICETTDLLLRIKRTLSFLKYLRACSENLVDEEGMESCRTVLAAAVEDCRKVESRASQSRPRKR